MTDQEMEDLDSQVEVSKFFFPEYFGRLHATKTGTIACILKFPIIC